MPNKYEKLTEPHKMISNIFANVNAGMEAGTKPLDKLFEDIDNVKDKFFKDIDKALPKEVTYMSRLEKENESLNKDREQLWKHNAGLQAKIDELEKKLAELVNICSDDQVRELAYILKREKEDMSKEINSEINEEKGKEIE